MVEALGAAAVLGVDPIRLLEMDFEKRYALYEVVEAASKFRMDLDRQLAQMVVDELAKAQRRGA